jgi:hypothetical protein
MNAISGLIQLSVSLLQERIELVAWKFDTRILFDILICIILIALFDLLYRARLSDVIMLNEVNDLFYFRLRRISLP